MLFAWCQFHELFKLQSSTLTLFDISNFWEHFEWLSNNCWAIRRGGASFSEIGVVQDISLSSPSLLPPLPFSLPSPLSLLPSPSLQSLPLFPSPLSNLASGSGERCKLPERVRAEPGRLTGFGSFWTKNKLCG